MMMMMMMNWLQLFVFSALQMGTARECSGTPNSMKIVL